MTTDRVRRRVAAAAATCVAVHWAVILHRRALAPGDFDVSREFGRRFLAGEPLYAGGLHYPYMPAAAMSFAPLALRPPTLGLALRQALALLSLWAITRWLAAFVRDRCPALAAADPTLAALPALLAAGARAVVNRRSLLIPDFRTLRAPPFRRERAENAER
jgi:hypothetical protein